jgi:hypothetical protein
MSRPGRPRVLDDAKRREICALLTAGCGIEAAARYVGCSPNTIRREALRNEDFRRQLRGAEVQMQLTPLQALRQAAHTHWRAAAWLLERTEPGRFAPRRQSACSPQDLLKAVDAAVETAVEEIADPHLRDRVCRRLLAAAHQSSKSLADAERFRLQGEASPFDPPKSGADADVENILAEIDRNRRKAVRSLLVDRDPPTVQKCA